MTDRHLDAKPWEVRALLDGRKTMMRLLAWKPISDEFREYVGQVGGGVPGTISPAPSPWQRVKPGDRLWVREAWAPDFDGCPLWRESRWGSEPFSPEDKPVKWRPSIHMPRWASRLTLIVTATKIERLQEISEADARAEGVEPLHEGFFPYGIATFMTVMQGDREVPAHYCPTAKVSFKMLWAHLHGPDSWDANPEVVALTFRVVRANIDSAEARAA